MPDKPAATQILTIDQLQRAQAAASRPKPEVALMEADKTEDLKPLRGQATPPE